MRKLPFMKIPNKTSRRGAFSLIEMMIVLGVVGLLLAFAAPNLFSLISSNSLSGEGVVLRNQLTYAQQIAVSKNADVEIRFFRMPDYANAAPEEAFRAYQLYQYNLDGPLQVEAWILSRLPRRSRLLFHQCQFYHRDLARRGDDLRRARRARRLRDLSRALFWSLRCLRRDGRPLDTCQTLRGKSGFFQPVPRRHPRRLS